MPMRAPRRQGRLAGVAALLIACLFLAGCSGGLGARAAAPSDPASTPGGSPSVVAPPSAATASGGPCATAEPSGTTAPSDLAGSATPSTPAGSVESSAHESAAPGTAEPTPAESATPQPPDTGSGTNTGGDIPDNAVFLRYRDASHGFAIKYVEGWQVTPTNDGVLIRDKDSSETVQVAPCITDIPGWVASTDLPALRAGDGFALRKQDTVDVGGQKLVHLLYRAPAPPDPVTGKRVPSLVDRYYVPGDNAIAVITLSTPDGVDNVDAFREMITSFRWR
jgi:hypothetical protein